MPTISKTLALTSILLLFGAITSIVVDAPILLFTFLYGLIAISPYYIKGWRGRIDVFRPHVIFSVLLYLYSLSTLAFIESFGETYYREVVSPEDVLIYSLSCLLGIAGLAIGAVIGGSNAMAHVHVIASDRDRGQGKSEQRVVLLGCILGFIFFATLYEKFVPWLASSYSDMALLMRVNSLQDKAAGLKEIFTETVPLYFVLSAAIVGMLGQRYCSIWARVIAYMIFACYVATAFLSGWRSQMMSAIILAAIYYHYQRKPISLRFVVVASILVYVVINFLSIMRGSSNPLEMIELLISTFNERGLQILAISQSGELATSTNLVRLISGIRLNEVDFGYGSIAFNQIGAFVPRVFMDDRPPIASELFVKTFYPGIYESGGGYGFFILQDGYWDFGVVGVLIYCVFFGFLTERIYSAAIGVMGSPFWTFIYGIVYYNLIFTSIRSGIFASIKSTLIVVLPMILIYFIANRFKRVLTNKTGV